MIAGTVIGFVVTRGNPLRFGIRSKFGFRKAQQRPYDVASSRFHTAQALKAAAAKEVKQHRFGLIVAVMGDGNRRGPTGPLHRA